MRTVRCVVIRVSLAACLTRYDNTRAPRVGGSSVTRGYGREWIMDGGLVLHVECLMTHPPSPIARPMSTHNCAERPNPLKIMEIKFKQAPFLVFLPIFGRFPINPLRDRHLRKCKQKLASGRQIFIALNVMELVEAREICVDKWGMCWDCGGFPSSRHAKQN